MTLAPIAHTMTEMLQEVERLVAASSPPLRVSRTLQVITNHSVTFRMSHNKESKAHTFELFEAGCGKEHFRGVTLTLRKAGDENPLAVLTFNREGEAKIECLDLPEKTLLKLSLHEPVV